MRLIVIIGVLFLVSSCSSSLRVHESRTYAGDQAKDQLAQVQDDARPTSQQSNNQELREPKSNNSKKLKKKVTRSLSQLMGPWISRSNQLKAEIGFGPKGSSISKGGLWLILLGMVILMIILGLLMNPSNPGALGIIVTTLAIMSAVLLLKLLFDMTRPNKR